MFFVLLERARPTGRHGYATGTNGDLTGVLSRESMIDRTTVGSGDTCDLLDNDCAGLKKFFSSLLGLEPTLFSGRVLQQDDHTTVVSTCVCDAHAYVVAVSE
ncbi:unnamed protein product [Nippostrongylus brasiliensis]|uniref:CPSF_A domain-containing protein n=1 Tax=Nippostrongylus brasiliensis TaxID=27835 RepID=A0A0N4YTB7_NIPBR|nr:unnamed protein product [Nippostrongylus brasiliensis]